MVHSVYEAATVGYPGMAALNLVMAQSSVVSVVTTSRLNMIHSASPGAKPVLEGGQGIGTTATSITGEEGALTVVGSRREKEEKGRLLRRWLRVA